MKIEWVNQGKEFQLPKINADIDIEILEYMETLPADVLEATSGFKFQKRNIIEYRETVYRVLTKIDKNITKEDVTKNLTVNELGALYIAMRLHGRAKYRCPHCKKEFIYEDMPVSEGDTPLPEKQKDDTTPMRKEE